MKIIAILLFATVISGCSSMSKNISLDGAIPEGKGIVMMNASCESKLVVIFALSTKTTTLFPEHNIRCGKVMGMDFTGVKFFDIEAGKYFLIGQHSGAKAVFAYEVEILPGKVNYLGSLEASDDLVTIKNRLYHKLNLSLTDNYEVDLKKVQEEYPEYPWNYEIVKSVPVEQYQIPK